MTDQDVQDVIDGVTEIMRQFTSTSLYECAGH
jgi:hypothetical protein